MKQATREGIQVRAREATPAACPCVLFSLSFPSFWSSVLQILFREEIEF